MIKAWFKKIIFNYKSKMITQKKIDEAYIIRDSKYLKKAYFYGKEYIKIRIVHQISKIPTQANFDFLLNELAIVDSTMLHSHIYFSVMTLAATNIRIVIQHEDKLYLNQNLHILKSLKYFSYSSTPTKKEYIPFRDKLKDHLGILEEMKKKNHIY